MRNAFIFLFIFLQGTMMGVTIDSIKFKDKEIPLIFEYNEKLPIFNMQLVIKNNGYIQDEDKSGITNLSAKLLNEGTLQDGAVEFARKLESKAIHLNASNGFETFVIELSCLSEQYIDALLLLNNLIKNPNLTQDSLDKIKTLTLSKLQQKENDYDYIARKELSRSLFNGTALENGSSGDIESIQNITLKDIQSRLETLFNIDNLIIVVGGKIDKNQFILDISKTLKLFKSHGNSNVETISMNEKAQNKTLYKDTEQAYIYFGSPFDISYDSENNYKAKVASFILGGSGFGSRLMEEIRVKNGLAYSAYGYITTQKSHSYFTGYLQTKIENEQKAKNMVISVIADFVKNGVTQEELDAAKSFLKGSEPLRVETFSQRLGRSFNLFYKNQAQDYPQKELALIDELELEDLNQFIQSHTEINNLTFSIVTQEEKKKEEK